MHQDTKLLYQPALSRKSSLFIEVIFGAAGAQDEQGS